MNVSRNMRFTLASLMVMFLVLAPQIIAQEKSCPVDLPVGLIDNKGTLLEGLTPQDLTIRQNKQSLTIESVKYDSAPRRILLLLDTSARLPVDAQSRGCSGPVSAFSGPRNGFLRAAHGARPIAPGPL